MLSKRMAATILFDSYQSITYCIRHRLRTLPALFLNGTDINALHKILLQERIQYHKGKDGRNNTRVIQRGLRHRISRRRRVAVHDHDPQFVLEVHVFRRGNIDLNRGIIVPDANGEHQADGSQGSLGKEEAQS